MYVQQEFGQTIREVSVGKIDEPLQLADRELKVDINAFSAVWPALGDLWSTHGNLRCDLCLFAHARCERCNRRAGNFCAN